MIEVDFVGGEVPTGPGSTVTFPTSLPALLGGNADIGALGFVGDTLFLKFKLPDTSQVAKIDSVTVGFTVFDNGDRGGESAEFDFALPGSNIILGSPAFTTLNGTTQTSPITFTYTLTADQISEILPTLTDGNFRLRVMRDTGDFEVAGATASIDVNTTPEPSCLLLAAAGIFGLGSQFQRRERRFRRK